MARLTRHTFRFIGIIGLMSVMLVSYAGVAHAASGQVSFSGVITKPTAENPIRDYPVELVSFGTQAMLPLNDRAFENGEIRVFDANGQRLNTGGTTYVPNNGKRLPAQLVDLRGSGQHVFIVCSGGRTNCVRYRVTRP